MAFSLRIYGYDEADPAGSAHALADAGFTLVTGGQDPQALAAFAREGLSYQLFFMPLRQAREEERCLDCTGQKSLWFGCGCQNAPSLRSRSLARVRQAAATAGVSGLTFDAARFAGALNPEGEDAFFGCFCPHCRAEMRRLGFDDAAIHAAVTALREHIRGGLGYDEARHGPGIDGWLAFRRLSTTAYLRELAQAAREQNPALSLGVYAFTPALAPLVGQGYAELAGIFDFVSPMLYRHYREAVGVCCLDRELAALLRPLERLSENARRPVLALYSRLTGLDFFALEPSRRYQSEGAPFALFAHEVRLAARLLAGSCAHYPILLAEDELLAQSVALCREAGAAGVDFFRYSPQISPALLRRNAGV